MTAGTAYFLMPDLQRPTGGIRRAYRFVDVLNEAGIDAAIVHAAHGYRCRWFTNNTHVVYATDLRLHSADLLVIPEIWATRIPSAAPGAAKVILSQNANLTFSHGGQCADSPAASTGRRRCWVSSSDRNETRTSLRTHYRDSRFAGSTTAWTRRCTTRRRRSRS